MNYDLKLNDFDNAGRKIIKIYFKEEDYIIYRSIENKIYILCTEENNKKMSKGTFNLAQIYNTIDKIDNLNDKLLEQIALAYKEYCSDNIKSAEAILLQVKNNILDFKRNKVNATYLIFCFIITVLAIVAFIMKFFFIKDINGNLQFIYKDVLNQGEIRILLHLINICIISSIAGVFSILISLNKKKYNYILNIDLKYHIISGLIRIFISVFAGLAIYFAIQSNIVFGFLQKNFELDKEKTPFLLYFLTFIAGFSENFVPNLIDKVESDIEKKEKDI